MAGLTTVPAVIRDLTDSEVMQLALIENLQREDLKPLEEANGYKMLMDNFEFTQEEIAKTVGKSRPAVANALRLLSLSPAVLELVKDGSLSAGHARALLRLPEEGMQLRVLERMAAGGWTVARTEQYIDALLTQDTESPKRTLAPFRLRGARVLLNAVQHQLELARASGVLAGSEQTETEREIVLTIRIPK